MLRKVLWVSTRIPEGFTEEKYIETVRALASTIKGEAVLFGESSYMIIGDDEAERKFKLIDFEAKANNP